MDTELRPACTHTVIAVPAAASAATADDKIEKFSKAMQNMASLHKL